MMPTKGNFWEDFTYNKDRVCHRASRMQALLSMLLNLSSKSLQEVIALLEHSSVFNVQDMSCLNEVLSLRAHEEQQLTLAGLTLQRERQEGLLKQQEELTRLRQRVQSINGYCLIETREPLVLVFNPRLLLLDGSCTVVEPREGPAWFRLERTNFPNLQPFGDMNYVLLNTRNQPLLRMVEQFAILEPTCFIHDSNGKKLLKVCNPPLQLPFVENHQITILSSPKTRVECRGALGHYQLLIDGHLAATMDAHWMWGYTVQLKPAQQDLLMIFGICCAIVRIKETKKRKERDAAMTRF